MILDKIADSTRLRIQQEQAAVPLEQLKAQVEQLLAAKPAVSANLPFETALEKPGLSFICEVKKASPSKGLIAPDFPYLDIARDYEVAGASAISVLTEPEFFKGDKTYLQEIAQTVQIPVLRKDFILSEYQIYEAKLIGASAVLLICALLDTDTLRQYLTLCKKLHLSALVEAHDAAEVESAMKAGAKIIGVNNRNLKDFTVDFHNAIRLRQMVPRDILFVAESGIHTPEDIKQLYDAGVDAVLIGESLMRAPDKTEQLDYLRKGCK